MTSLLSDMVWLPEAETLVTVWLTVKRCRMCIICTPWCRLKARKKAQFKREVGRASTANVHLILLRIEL